MATVGEKRRASLREISARIEAAQRPLRVLRAVGWADGVKERFFASGCRELPQPEYPPLGFDARATVDELADIIRALRVTDPLERMLMDTCVSYINCARLLGRIGTKDFHRLSREIYGAPSDRFDQDTTQLELALHFDRALAGFAPGALGPEPPSEIDAEAAADLLRAGFAREFVGVEPPRVEISDDILADASAVAGVVRVRRGARFSEWKLRQLEQHEGYVHAATTLNGRRQGVLACLGKGAPRTTRTQEGLAVFAELVTQNLEVERIRVLKDRVIAIKMAEDGADFVQLYRFFLDAGHGEEKAFDSARRVTRGGLVEGGAPFTKDVGYLDGLLRVYDFARIAMKRGKPDLVRFLWAGKVSLEDVPVLVAASREGLVDPPAFLPSWMRNLHALAGSLSFAAFLGTIDLASVELSYEPLLQMVE